MELFTNLSMGFGEALTSTNLLYAFLGCLLGTLIGVLPGLGPAATIAMLLPLTFALDPTTALIMLAGIYYGAQYGGSTTAILVNIPGESSSVVTALDGYQLARQGRAGLALSAAAIGSFVAGSVATLGIAALATPLASLALSFHAAEYFSLMVLGLVASVVLAHGSLLRAFAMIVTGLIVGTVGLDLTSGTYRFAFGQLELLDGFDIVAIAMGIFGVSEVMANLAQPDRSDEARAAPVSRLLPTGRELARMVMPIIRGSGLGMVLGILPGGGALLSSFASYALEKRISSHPETFGKGAVEGVAGPEAANNAGAQTSFIPMLTLGIPSNTVMALMVGAMLLHGIQPGPGIVANQPTLFWGLIASMWIGNLMLLILNLPLVGLWVKLLRMPYKFLFPGILVFCSIGVFSLSNRPFEVFVMVGFGLFGYVLRRLNCESAPFILALILGPMLEEYLRRSLLISHGNPAVFVTRPISAVLLLVALVSVVMVLLPAVRRTRETAMKE